MADLPTNFTDTDYEDERRTAERLFRENFEIWSGKIPKRTGFTIPGRGKDPVSPEQMCKLAEICGQFIKADLSAFVSLLWRLRIPESQGINALDTHWHAIQEETKEQKWLYGLSKYGSFLRSIDTEGASFFWDNLHDENLKFLREELHSRLWFDNVGTVSRDGYREESQQTVITESRSGLSQGADQQVKPQPVIVANGSKADQHAAGGEKPRLRSNRGRKKGTGREEVRLLNVAIRDLKKDGCRLVPEILEHLIRRESVSTDATPIVAAWRKKHGVNTWSEVKSKSRSNPRLHNAVSKRFSKVNV